MGSPKWRSLGSHVVHWTSPPVQVRVVMLVKDMSDISAVKNTLEELPEDCRDIDILLNNAGLALGVDAGHEADTEVCIFQLLLVTYSRITQLSVDHVAILPLLSTRRSEAMVRSSQMRHTSLR